MYCGEILQSSYVAGLCAANKVLTRLPGGCGVARPKTSCLEVSQASCDSTYSPRTSGYRGRAFRSHGVENMSTGRNHGWDCMLLNKSNKNMPSCSALGKFPNPAGYPFFSRFSRKISTDMQILRCLTLRLWCKTSL